MTQDYVLDMSWVILGVPVRQSQGRLCGTERPHRTAFWVIFSRGCPQLADERPFGRRSLLNALKRRRANRNRVDGCRQGSDASAPRKQSHFHQSGFRVCVKTATGQKSQFPRSNPTATPAETPRLKPEENRSTRTARLESRAPPHECGGSHDPIWASLTSAVPSGLNLARAVLTQVLKPSSAQPGCGTS